jgi:phosphoribosylformylglycinamidine synthase
VSFYNQSEEGPVYPTPTIGMVGVLDSLDQKMTMNFKNPGDLIYMIGTHRDDINCSDYLHQICGVSHSPAPYFDLDEEAKVQQTITRLISEKIINSAHDISEGGLFTCVLESAMSKNLGFALETDSNIRKDAYLFGEAQSRVIVSVNPELQKMFEAEIQNVVYSKLGKVMGDGSIHIDNEEWGYISDWKNAYDTAIEKMLS